MIDEINSVLDNHKTCKDLFDEAESLHSQLLNLAIEVNNLIGV